MVPSRLVSQSGARWTAAQEQAIARDYPLGLDRETPAQFVARTYLQFLWLPESIMPLPLLVPSLRRVQHDAATHPLHALLDPLLLSVRAVVAKYHTELPQILAQDGGAGESEESMMWYALAHDRANTDDAVLLDESARNAWLERLERREVQIQILLYLLKLSLPGPCTPLPPLTVPAPDVAPKKKRKERPKAVVPSPHERLESFMDKLCTWQLVIHINDTETPKDERDWMQAFCQDVVEREFQSLLPDLCALLRRKLFPHSPFSDDDSEDASANPRSKAASRKLVRSSTSARQRSPSTQSHTSDARSRSRSLSVSLAQDASARRSNTSTASSSLKRALSRQVSMSRGFKPKAQQPQAPPKPKEAPTRQDEKRSQGVTLVAATPVKSRVKPGARKLGLTQSRAQSPEHVDDTDRDSLPGLEGEDEELWLPDSSPDVFLLGARKRSASGSSSSVGLSDSIDGVHTPVRKRMRT